MSQRSPPVTSPTSTTPQSTPPFFTRPLSRNSGVATANGVVDGNTAAPPPISAETVASLRVACENAHFPRQLELYLADLFTAARHHHRVDGNMLTLNAMEDAKAFACAWRVLVNGEDVELVEIIAESMATQAISSGISLPISARSITIDVPLITMDGIETQKQNVVGEPPLVVLNVSEADVARMVPRVISHRLRIRDGPASEVFGSMVHGATMEETGVEEYRKTTVKDVLVGILTEV